MNSRPQLAARLKLLDPQQCASLASRLRLVRTDGHRLVAAALQQLGVSHVHGISGVPVDATLAACATGGMRVIHARHQQGAVMMALAQNYGAGRLASAVILSPGPALTNALTGVLIARDNGWPLVVLGARCPLDLKGMGAFQELDAVPLFQPISKWAAVVPATGKIPEYIEKAFEVALEGTPGPVYLELPEDLLVGSSSCAYRCAYPAPQQPVAGEAQVMRAAALLSTARRPLVIIGKGVRWSAPFEALRLLLEARNIPFITSPMARGYLPDDHPLCGNLLSSQLQREADVALVLGARLDWTFRYGAELSRRCKIIQVDTDKAAIGGHHAVALGVVGDARAFVQAVHQQLAVSSRGDFPDASNEHCSQRLESLRAPKRAALEALTQGDGSPMTPHQLMGAIQKWLPHDALCVLDANINMAAAQQVLQSYEPVSRLTPGTNGALGIGVPYAIGLKLQYPKRLVMAISGDFAFGLTAMELETAVRHRVPIILVIANNDGSCGALRQKNFYPADYPERVTQFQPGIEYDRMMTMLGGYGEHVTQVEQLPGALERAHQSGLPACINVRVDPDAPYPRPL